MSETPEERGFAAYLEGDTELSRLYRVSAKDLPSQALDAAVLERARDAVRARRATGPFAANWSVPLSLAAVIVVSVTVVVLMPPEDRSLPPVESAPAPVEAPALESHADDAGDAERLDHARDESTASEASVVEPASVDEVRELKKVTSEERLDEDRAGAQLEQDPTQGAGEGGQTSAVSKQVGATTGAGETMNAVSSSQTESDTRPSSAEEWLELIEELVDHGRVEEARVAFYAFRSSYPNREISQDLLDRLGF